MPGTLQQWTVSAVKDSTGGGDTNFTLSRAQEDGEIGDGSAVFQESIFFEDAFAQRHGWKSKEISQYYNRDQNDLSIGPIADTDGLRKYLKERYGARQAKRYDRVDEIDKILKEQYGIRVFDNPNIWTRQIHQPPISYQRKVERKQLEKLKAMFGPNGHPYCRIGRWPFDDRNGMLDLSMTQIHTLLSRSELHRMEGRYEEYDATLFELLIHGVNVCRTTKRWRADGNTDFSVADDNQRSPPMNVPTYYMVEDPSNNDNLLESSKLKRVNQLIIRRAECLMREEHDLAQFIAVELFKTYNVVIDDAACCYSFRSVNTTQSQPGWSPPTIPSPCWEQSNSRRTKFPPLLFLSSVPHQTPENVYVCSHQSTTEGISSSTLSPSVRQRVDHLVQERAYKVEERKMLEAIAIQRELQMTYGVSIDDDKFEWTAVSSTEFTESTKKSAV